MECKDCKYYRVDNFNINGKTYANSMCEITHLCYPKHCTYINNDDEVKDMDICYNCKYWIGGGDWGLSCDKDYWNCNTNGFHVACKQFEKRK